VGRTPGDRVGAESRCEAGAPIGSWSSSRQPVDRGGEQKVGQHVVQRLRGIDESGTALPPLVLHGGPRHDEVAQGVTDTTVVVSECTKFVSV
jgi:hypothetical protein